MNSFVFLEMTYQPEQNWLTSMWIVLQPRASEFLRAQECFISPFGSPVCLCFFNFLPIEVHFWVRIPVKTPGISAAAGNAQRRLSGGQGVE